MRKTTLRRIGMLALCLTLITACLMGGTLAKYTTTVSGSGSMTTASWKFDVKINDKAETTESATFTLPAEKMYPGMDDVVIPVYVKNGSDAVQADYTVEVAVSNMPANMTATFGDAAVTNGEKYTTAAKTLNDGGEETTKLTLSWLYNADKVDNSDAGKTVTVTIKVVGNQLTDRA